MRYFRLSVFGVEVLRVALAAPERPAQAPVYVVRTTEPMVTQSSGFYFAETAQDVAYDEAFAGCDGECEGCEDGDD